MSSLIPVFWTSDDVCPRFQNLSVARMATKSLSDILVQAAVAVETVTQCKRLGPVYRKYQHQHCNNSAMTLAILFSMKTMELLLPANEVWGKVIFLHLLFCSWGRYPLGRYPPPDRCTPWAGTPLSPGQVHPPQAGTPQWAGTPPSGRYPRAGTPPRQIPPRQVHPPKAGTPPGRYTPWVGTLPPRNACWDTVNKRVVCILLECILVPEWCCDPFLSDSLFLMRIESLV